MAWIDDAHDDALPVVGGRPAGPTLLVTTDPAVGVTDREVERLLAWARGLG